MTLLYRCLMMEYPTLPLLRNAVPKRCVSVPKLGNTSRHRDFTVLYVTTPLPDFTSTLQGITLHYHNPTGRHYTYTSHGYTHTSPKLTSPYRYFTKVYITLPMLGLTSPAPHFTSPEHLHTIRNLCLALLYLNGAWHYYTVPTQRNSTPYRNVTLRY